MGAESLRIACATFLARVSSDKITNLRFARFLRSERKLAVKKEIKKAGRAFPSQDVRPVKQADVKGKEKKTLIKEVTAENQYLRLSETVTPLWKTPYSQQLKIKYTSCVKSLRRLSFELKRVKAKKIDPAQSVACPLRMIIPSPVVDYYRNKDEFSIRNDVTGHSKTIGFFIGSPAKNSDVICVNPYELVNIKNSHKLVVQAFQYYINSSKLDACVDFTSGHWRNIIVRSNIHEELMAIVVMHPQNLSQEELEEERSKLSEYFAIGDGHECNLKSLYFQACRHTRCTHEQAPFELLHGKPYIVEEVSGLKFRISPESFFQVNTAGAEVLFKTIKELARVEKNTTVLDICCGTGAIGLYLSGSVKSVVGIESSVQALEDAKANAELNNITNASFLAQKVEHALSAVLPEIYAEDLVAIVNPARGGLSNTVLKTLRECKHLRRIVYVSCKPQGKAMDNFVTLCSPSKWYSGTEPFFPTLAIPVDLFPHTKHCELIIMFERLR